MNFKETVVVFAVCGWYREEYSLGLLLFQLGTGPPFLKVAAVSMGKLPYRFVLNPLSFVFTNIHNKPTCIWTINCLSPGYVILSEYDPHLPHSGVLAVIFIMITKIRYMTLSQNGSSCLAIRQVKSNLCPSASEAVLGLNAKAVNGKYDNVFMGGKSKLEDKRPHKPRLGA